MELLKGWIVALPLGAILASVIAAMISSEGLRLIFVAIALAVAQRMLFDQPHWRLGRDLPPNPWKWHRRRRHRHALRR